VSTVVSAWRRAYLRDTLQHFEQQLLPAHPAGEMDLTGTELGEAVARFGRIGGPGQVGGLGGGVFALETHTVGDEVCCSTGDLSCVTDESCQSVVSHCETEGGCPTDPGSGLSCDGPCGTDRPHHCP
jgi:mersacidin/lichenicidin family type 2 lantibiotic